MRKVKSKGTESSNSERHSLIPRRDFFKYLGSGILILVYPLKSCSVNSGSGEESRSLPKDFNAFLHIGEDGMVKCFTGKVELGQGNTTALAMMMADELDIPYENVKMVMGDTDLCPWDGGTWGSTSIRKFGPIMRIAAAEAKAVLLQLGSEYLKVPVNQLVTSNGTISVKGNDKRTVTYGQLTKGKKIEKYLKESPEVKKHTEFKIITKPYLRQDAFAKVTGEAKYSGDIKLPGMLYARIVRPPNYRGKLVTADTSLAEKIEGIQVVRDGDLVALLHKDRDKVDEAIIKVKAEYSSDEMTVNDKTVYDHFDKSGRKGIIVNKAGDVKKGREISDGVFESVYRHSYVAHAPIEPHTAAASTDGDKITVWASAQTPFPTQEAIAKALGLGLDKVRVIVPYVGGGFGGKGDNPQAVEAARLTKITGKPVMVAWTRPEEFFCDTLRSAALVKLSSGIDSKGKITFWDYSVYYAGDRGSETIYDVPDQLTTVYEQGENDPEVHPFATGPWRAPGNSNNTFAREMQICIMAAKAGMDPLDFRLKNLKDEKMIEVLRAAADKFGYVSGKSPSGRGYGIACGTDVDTWMAMIAEVEVDKKTGRVKVIRVACAQDMGLCVNPAGTVLQMEGCITMGLGYALTEEVLFEGGKMFTSNFDNYEIPKFSWVPKIDTVVLNKPDQPPHGGGEPAVIGMGAVIASGIFDATGAVLYDMPMTPARVLEALKKV